jgi:serine/threonine protein kinase
MQPKHPHRDRLPSGKQIEAYQIQKLIGHGGYGDIYSAIHSISGTTCAVKIEFITGERHALFQEIQLMQKLPDCPYFPHLLAHGICENFRYAVMPLWGPSLDAMRRVLPGQKYSAASVLFLALESLNCIEALHFRGFLHRDIKPSNFLIRPDRSHPVCLIDFGLSDSFLNAKGKHSEPAFDVGFTGTFRYASANAHAEKRLSRRDDLISWFYSMIEIAVGKMPWPGSKDCDTTKRMKAGLSEVELCRGLPREFCEIWEMIRKLGFKQEPCYCAIRGVLRRAIKRLGIDGKPKFDWEVLGTDVVEEISAIPLVMEDNGPGEWVESEDEGGCVACAVA